MCAEPIDTNEINELRKEIDKIKILQKELDFIKQQHQLTVNENNLFRKQIEQMKQENSFLRQQNDDLIRTYKVYDFVGEQEETPIHYGGIDYLSFFSDILNFTNEKKIDLISSNTFKNVVKASIDLSNKYDYLSNIREDEVNELNVYEDNQCDIMDILSIQHDGADTKYNNLILNKVRDLQNSHNFNLPLDESPVFDNSVNVDIEVLNKISRDSITFYQKQNTIKRIKEIKHNKKYIGDIELANILCEEGHKNTIGGCFSVNSYKKLKKYL